MPVVKTSTMWTPAPGGTGGAPKLSGRPVEIAPCAHARRVSGSPLVTGDAPCSMSLPRPRPLPRA